MKDSTKKLLQVGISAASWSAVAKLAGDGIALRMLTSTSKAKAIVWWVGGMSAIVVSAYALGEWAEYKAVEYSAWKRHEDIPDSTPETEE